MQGTSGPTIRSASAGDFQLIKEDSSTTLSARVQRERSKRSLQSMTKEDATNFPYRLKRWWEDCSPSSERLEAIAWKVKAFDDQIPYHPLADEMDSLHQTHLSMTDQLSDKDQDHLPEGQTKGTESDQAQALINPQPSSAIETSGAPIHSTILPLTIDGAGILLADLQDGDG
ncbi:hypothetical protein ABVK25_002991 [Lepraria finkii]|uniref:Uncharacterized protein n=1 Tax=Lepraria finkii TaxID=1340010 RepID=A0ABR4BGQ1_9LECA